VGVSAKTPQDRYTFGQHCNGALTSGDAAHHYSRVQHCNVGTDYGYSRRPASVHVRRPTWAGFQLIRCATSRNYLTRSQAQRLAWPVPRWGVGEGFYRLRWGGIPAKGWSGAGGAYQVGHREPLTVTMVCWRVDAGQPVGLPAGRRDWPAVAVGSPGTGRDGQSGRWDWPQSARR